MLIHEPFTGSDVEQCNIWQLKECQLGIRRVFLFTVTTTQLLVTHKTVSFTFLLLIQSLPLNILLGSLGFNLNQPSINRAKKNKNNDGYYIVFWIVFHRIPSLHSDPYVARRLLSAWFFVYLLVFPVTANARYVQIKIGWKKEKGNPTVEESCPAGFRRILLSGLPV